MKIHHLLISSLALVSLHYARNLHAEEAATPPGYASPVLTNEGIAGNTDKKHRNPTLAVQTIVQPNNVKILVDAAITNKAYSEMPIRFDFFVNRTFVTSQIRSPELPGAVGIDVGKSVATPPFNYAVIATILHPNRQFVSAIYGAVYEAALATTFSCSLALTNTPTDKSDPVTTTYAATEVGSTQDGADSFALNFTGTEELDAESESTAKTSETTAALKVTGSEITGTVKVTVDGVTTTYETKGTATKSDNNLTALEVSSSDNKVTLVCE